MRPIAPGRTITATGRWLLEDPAAPGGTLIPSSGLAIPSVPTWSIAPPTVTAPVTVISPVVVAEVEAPEPPEAPELYGNAQWMKVYKTQLPHEVTGTDIEDGNLINTADLTQLEVAWDLLQIEPPSNGNQNRRRHQNQGGILATTRSIVRRFETYKYTGAYDAITHRAVCADAGLCNAPTINASVNELGDLIGAQVSALNLVPDAITVTKIGNGTVTGANNTINCGNACSAFVTAGTAVTLTENPGGNVFTGWSGACTGTQITCTVTVTGAATTTATFKTPYTLSIGRSNNGTVTGTPAGNDRSINCGGACSAKFLEGTVVTLTATPPAGKQFLGWDAPCSGNGTCSLSINRDTSVKANFSK